MPELWESSIYPIVKDIIESNTDESQVSDSEVVILSNLICRAIDKKYSIEKK